MHRPNLAHPQPESNSPTLRSASYVSTTASTISNSPYPLNFLPGSDLESESDINNHPYLQSRDDDDDRSSMEPPPSYEHSISTSRSSTSPQQHTQSNPFQQNIQNGRIFGQSSFPRYAQISSDQEIFVPSIAARHSPLAPPLNLLASTTSNAGLRSSSSPSTMSLNSTLDDLLTISTNNSSSTLPRSVNDSFDSTSNRKMSSTSHGKRPVRNQFTGTNTDSESTLNNTNNIDDEIEALAFGVQPAISPSYMHLTTTSSLTSDAPYQQRRIQEDYFNTQDGTSSTQLRTARRLKHKQAHARHAASAPDLSSLEALASRAAAVADSLSGPRVPLSQSIIPAPPPRLLQFRSRQPSSLPACPFLLCQKPIMYTKTRYERGVTVWMICGLLFFLNAYWTTQSLISHFSSPNHERVYSPDVTSSIENSGFSAKGEVMHLMKGFLGFKTHRYNDPNIKSYHRHQKALKRPTVATVGVVQDEMSVLRAILSYCLLVTVTIIRWWMCLTPLLIRPLFDTVHSCPHPHPYPFPEELEQERREQEQEQCQEEEEFQRQLARQQQKIQESLSTFIDEFRGNEKQRLRARDEAENVALMGGEVINTSNENDINNNSTTGTEEPPPTSVSKTGITESTKKDKNKNKKAQKDLFKFFKRFRATRQQKQEQVEQVLATTVFHMKKKKLSWRMRREMKKKEERRKAIIKASQDIGRYSLLFQLGSFISLDRWGRSINVGPGLRG
ncbi:hypothetical protein FBU30_008554 [Linnemannia zychae]|nr:hypothetical protein FBU30_008554 [Linnemannia zychae]